MAFLAYPFANLILLFYSWLGHNTVIAIAALTVLINLLLIPFTLMQQRSARKMQALQPEIERLRKKCGKDQERFLREQQKLFQREGVSTFGGCLPLLIQFPIWIGLYQAIRYCVPTTPLDVFQFSQHIYKWLPGVVGLVPQQSRFLGMDLGLRPSSAQWWSYSLPVLVFAVNWLQQKLMAPPPVSDDGEQSSQGSTMAQQMQMMQTTMPLMMMLFTLTWPTGLSIYFIISGVIRIVQQYVIKLGENGEEAKSQAPLKRQRRKR